MSIELVAVGLNSAAAVLTVGCFALIRLTVKNFRSDDGGLETDAEASAGKSATHRHPLYVEFQSELLRETKGDTRLLAKLGLPSDMRPSLLVDGEHLTPAAVSIGFSSLELVIRQVQKLHSSETPYLFGVNRGGGLLANLLSQRLRLDQKYLVRCDYKLKWKRVLCEHRPDVRLAIVIDDAVRSGETLTAVREKLAEVYPNARIYVLALVVSALKSDDEETRNRKLFGLVDYYSWISYQKQTTLPWSNDDREDATDYIDEEGVNQLVGRLLSHTAAEEAGGVAN